MKRIGLSLAIAASLSLSGCATLAGLPPTPGAVAEQTKIDEQVGLTVTLAYTAAARAAALGIETGLIKGPMVARIGVLNRQAYAAVLAVRAAYEAGNASGYLAALKQARAAIGDLLTAVKG